ncbi:MAG TPA: CHAT domain-containing protein, partial [Chloroflexia bacterium]|nr:CHAT domain-containing protein [Chloroflexia bacterium]
AALPPRWVPPLTLYAPPPHNKTDILAAMATGAVNLFHFATHGSFDATAPTQAALLIGTSRLTADDVAGPDLRDGLTRSAPLVFLNACHSGREAPALSGIGGWVDKLLRFGCSGFVGTNWEVQDELAAQFAIHFYDLLRAGQTFGAACREARQQIRQANPGNSTWLAYVLYAHPNGTLRAGPRPI